MQSPKHFNSRSFKSSSILGVPQRHNYPLKDELYRMRYSLPNSPKHGEQDPSLGEFKRNLQRIDLGLPSKTPALKRTDSEVMAPVPRPYTRLDLEPMASPSSQSSTLRILQLLNSTGKAKAKPHMQRASKYVAKSGMDQSQSNSGEFENHYSHQASRNPEMYTRSNPIHIKTGKKWSSSLSPTKVVREIVGLNKQPFGMHSAYHSKPSFKLRHVVEKETVKWLDVHASKRVSFDRKQQARPKPAY